MAPFTRVLGWDRIEVELFVKAVKKEWKIGGIHGCFDVYAVWGQKPLE